ncbi:hypothetical protein GGS20DRAFT_449423 [Poronia punctata]|nr:hypothetical protein GGS20DRAFT_449423 [Poronia punctata]
MWVFCTRNCKRNQTVAIHLHLDYDDVPVHNALIYQVTYLGREVPSILRKHDVARIRQPIDSGIFVRTLSQPSAHNHHVNYLVWKWIQCTCKILSFLASSIVERVALTKSRPNGKDGVVDRPYLRKIVTYQKLFHVGSVLGPWLSAIFIVHPYGSMLYPDDDLLLDIGDSEASPYDLQEKLQDAILSTSKHSQRVVILVSRYA